MKWFPLVHKEASSFLFHYLPKLFSVTFCFTGKTDYMGTFTQLSSAIGPAKVFRPVSRICLKRL